MFSIPFQSVMTGLMYITMAFWVGVQLWHFFALHLVSENTGEQLRIDLQAQRLFERFLALPLLLLLFLCNLSVLIGQRFLTTNGRVATTISVPLFFVQGLNVYRVLSEVVITLAIGLALYNILTARGVSAWKSLLSWGNLLLGFALVLFVVLSEEPSFITGAVLVYVILAEWLRFFATALLLGGIAYLAIIYLSLLRKETLSEQARILVKLLARFAPLALIGTIILIATEVFLVETYTAAGNVLLPILYDRLFLMKLGLILLLIGVCCWLFVLLRPQLGGSVKKYLALQDQYIVQTGPNGSAPFERQGRLLDRTIRVQIHDASNGLRVAAGLGVFVLLCSGGMSVLEHTFQSQHADTSQQTEHSIVPPKPVSKTTRTRDGALTLEIRVAPDQPGENTFTVRILSANKAANVPMKDTMVTVFTSMLDMDMGTDVLHLQSNDTELFQAKGYLNMAGNWQLRVLVQTPDTLSHDAIVNIYAPA